MRGRRRRLVPPAKGSAQVNTVDDQQVLGRNIAQQRRRHGRSQPEFAAIELPLSELAASAPGQTL